MHGRAPQPVCGCAGCGWAGPRDAPSSAGRLRSSQASKRRVMFSTWRPPESRAWGWPGASGPAALRDGRGRSSDEWPPGGLPGHHLSLAPPREAHLWTRGTSGTAGGGRSGNFPTGSPGWRPRSRILADSSTKPRARVFRVAGSVARRTHRNGNHGQSCAVQGTLVCTFTPRVKRLEDAARSAGGRRMIHSAMARLTAQPRIS